MTAQFKIIPHPLHDIVPQPPFDEDEERRRDEPRIVLDRLPDQLRWLDASGYTKELDDIWFEFYYGARK